MGLNAVAYNNIKLIAEKNCDREDLDYDVYLFNNEDCSQNVKKEGYYTGERLYSTGNVSYSTYGEHRRKLCKAVTGLTDREVWNDPKPNYPFIEMINFSDCEGGFDNEVCVKLAKDFAEWEDKIKLIFKDDTYFLYFYEKWYFLFKKASDNNGVVSYC